MDQFVAVLFMMAFSYAVLWFVIRSAVLSALQAWQPAPRRRASNEAIDPDSDLFEFNEKPRP